jgi:hypothetical protein
MGIVTKYLNGYKIHTFEETPIEKIFNPIKSASVEPEVLSSWARLDQSGGFGGHESPMRATKSASTESKQKSASKEDSQLSSWARLDKLRSS